MVVMWKDEDEVNGEAIGPVYVVNDSGEIKESLGWMSKTQAKELAEGNEYEFEES